MILFLPSILFAQEVSTTDEINTPEELSDQRITELEERLLHLQEEAIVSQTERLLLQQQIQYLSTAINTRLSIDQRQFAVQELNKIASPNALPFYWSLMCYSDDLSSDM